MPRVVEVLGLTVAQNGESWHGQSLFDTWIIHMAIPAL